MSKVRWYDLVAAYPIDLDDQFLRRLREFAGQCGVNLFVAEPLWIKEFLARYVEGRIGIGVLLDLGADFTDPANPYTRLSRLAKEKGATVINDPDRAARFGDKTEAHLALEAAEMPVPYGVVVRSDEIPWRVLTEEERQGLGLPFFAKPAHGYAGKGVISDARAISDVKRCQAEFPDTSYLLQRRVSIGKLCDNPTYWRVFYVLSEIFVCWWHPVTKVYTVTPQWQVYDHGLWPLFELGHRMSEVTGLRCFSIEVARTPAGEYVLVDYVNDQIDLRPKSFFTDGVPDEIVRHVAWKVARNAEDTQRPRHVDRECDLKEELFPRVKDRFRAAMRPWPPVPPMPAKAPTGEEPASQEVGRTVQA